MPHSKKPRFCLTLEDDNEMRVQADGTREGLIMMIMTAMDDELVMDIITGAVLCLAHMEDKDDLGSRQNLN
jgi:hypothetical protein